MKVKFIQEVGTTLRISFGCEKPAINLGNYPIDADVSNPPEGISWEILKDKYPDMRGWGFNMRYNTESGRPEAGDMYYADWMPENFYWDNHKGPYLILVLPNGHEWNIDSRASNCTMKEDRLHRCWCRHGEPPNVTVDKIGVTCQAGAGSILMGDFHGFLTNGEIK